MKTKKKAVLVTTEFRGVFFGYMESDKKLPGEVTLTDARNCIYWNNALGGFLGLATYGPSAQCKIGSKADKLTLYKVTSVSQVTSEAEQKWNCL